MPQSFVLKLGGSLFTHVDRIVPILQCAKHPVLIIPGGGPFANLVRKFHIADESSHWMAIAAMEEYGWYIAGHGIPVTDQLVVPNRVMVCLPYIHMRHTDPLPHTWDVSSDSIAAWIAYSIGLDLILLKSVDGLMQGGSIVKEIREPINCQEVDPYFINFVLSHGMRAIIINGLHAERIKEVLEGKPVLGTTIYTTL